ncbi:hypothetical protein SAMN03097699_0147 [Flavobacteriaceae bacterium MAR_2010_188]|nr:hypothetical protein SAMN03097699_0147 [Flavobacteriaceae bacterium MAR_2010_188]
MGNIDIDAKIYVDPSCDILYSSFYIYGLQQVYGKKQIKFISKYFKDFKHDNHFFAFVVVNNKSIKKIIIDFTDSSNIDEKVLNWCDVYGKINLEENLEYSEKIVAIGPSFGIQIYNPIETVFIAIKNFIKSSSRIPNKRRFFSDYRSQLKRPSYSDYLPERTKPNFIFFLSSLWKREISTNSYRSNFIKACKENQNIEFKGGFAPRSKNDIQGFEENTLGDRMSIDEYLHNTKLSILVFNTPAVKSCHGWKLAEFLCLGKAIITTPLSRVMPGSIIAGVHYLQSDGSKSDISLKIESLVNDSAKRLALETNARKYFMENLEPKIVIQKLLSMCSE